MRAIKSFQHYWIPSYEESLLDNIGLKVTVIFTVMQHFLLSLIVFFCSHEASGKKLDKFFHGISMPRLCVFTMFSGVDFL